MCFEIMKNVLWIQASGKQRYFAFDYLKIFSPNIGSIGLFSNNPFVLFGLFVWVMILKYVIPWLKIGWLNWTRMFICFRNTGSVSDTVRFYCSVWAKNSKSILSLRYRPLSIRPREHCLFGRLMIDGRQMSININCGRVRMRFHGLWVSAYGQHLRCWREERCASIRVCLILCQSIHKTKMRHLIFVWEP